MRLRSLLFVPADRPDRFAKAAGSGADAIILDLEDSVHPHAKDAAAREVAAFLSQSASGVLRLVRINPLDSGRLDADLAAARRADGIVLPKAEGAASIRQLVAQLGSEGPPVLPIATETPAAIFSLGSYSEVADHLLGISWGAEDLPAAIGAATAREGDGRYTPPYEMVRGLALFGAHAAGVAALDTVYPALADQDGLERYAARAARDGFTGMLALHPAQVPVINAAFTPTPDQLDEARAVIAAFAAEPGAGVLRHKGRMLDAPHLKQAQRLLARAGA
ncbi:HpcH/HpaI aldolase/citrate lyase family protein [Sphingomonas desiccabilis]|uniref:CoA ester lyase n=1 Tax=Sphingomonas desiccabilis TaxID=429134 RepID=A0A4V1QP77_9SPHN|nr:CoA ester lyase [Sphingomonas desiccabilis]MBB3910975.1 citrate lyase subunit beta/citryl-CoA lyase [Sphingomonas desiccabilis]RXZ32204.1 CoA ester lyase [Sphingomonas desiccabilis]